jgi:RND family efflux transporter MFP subunit
VWSILRIALVLLLAVGFSGVADAQGRNLPPPTLVGDAVRQETASETAAVVGRFVALRGGPIAARIGGAVDEVLVGVGDRVEKDQTLIRIAQDRLKAERARRRALLNLASARISSAKASLRLAQQSANRLARLRKSAAFSEALLADKQREAERAAAQVKEAQADYARSKAELKLADVDLAYSDVRAPYAGVVMERHVDVGGFVPLGGPVVSLLGVKAMEVEAEAPTERMGGATPGAIVTVRYNGVTAAVPVRAVIPRETGVSRTRPIRFGPLPPALAAVAVANASVTVDVPVAEAQSVLTVHKDAVIRRGKDPSVMVARASDEAGLYQAEPRTLRLGPAIGGRFGVLSGVGPGEIVVVRGNEGLRPGQPFKLAGDQAAGPPEGRKP